MVGAPKYTRGFKAQSAWEFVTHPNVGTFKTSYSKAFHIKNCILRFTQTFIGYNLMGTSNSAMTTTDLYFTWCMAKGVKVHLGYWLAQSCHQMTGNPGRHMYTCHLLGAYLQRNIIMKIAKSAPEILMCEPPENFSVEYFFNKGLLYTHGNDVFFYEVGRMETQVKSEPDGMETVASVDYEEMKKEMGEMRKELGGVQEEIKALRGSITDLVGKSSIQSDRMTDAVKIMMRLADWLETKFSQTQKKLPPGSSSVTTQPGQGSSSLQRPPLASKPLLIPSASKPLTVKKPVSRQPEKEEEKPESPARKKVKMNRPNVPPQSGSRGARLRNDTPPVTK